MSPHYLLNAGRVDLETVNEQTQKEDLDPGIKEVADAKSVCRPSGLL